MELGNLLCYMMLIGMWIILSSAIKFQFALKVKDSSNSNWIIILTLSIITFILGLLMIINPIGSMITITTFGGVVLFITEIINIIEYIMIILNL